MQDIVITNLLILFSDETTTVDRPESFWRDFRLDNTLYNISGRNNGSVYYFFYVNNS